MIPYCFKSQTSQLYDIYLWMKFRDNKRTTTFSRKKSHIPIRRGKKGGNFKTGIFLEWKELLLYCLAKFLLRDVVRSYKFTFFFVFFFVTFFSIFQIFLLIHSLMLQLSILNIVPGFLTGFFYPDSGFSRIFPDFSQIYPDFPDFLDIKIF